jgi:hypothetical protein
LWNITEWGCKKFSSISAGAPVLIRQFAQIFEHQTLVGFHFPLSLWEILKTPTSVSCMKFLNTARARFEPFCMDAATDSCSISVGLDQSEAIPGLCPRREPITIVDAVLLGGEWTRRDGMI